ncbi:MAG TPA: hypothetical protein VHC43_08010 [Mycobacteriales bacterium]|nr:hypothetical protein [Mycobacteriales bacterium]
MTTEVSLGHCVVCHEAVDPSGPGVSAPPNATWQPFVEDVRSSDMRLLHPTCFVSEFGSEALIAAVHREDLRRMGRLQR